MPLQQVLEGLRALQTNAVLWSHYANRPIAEDTPIMQWLLVRVLQHADNLDNVEAHYDQQLTMLKQLKLQVHPDKSLAGSAAAHPDQQGARNEWFTMLTEVNALVRARELSKCIAMAKQPECMWDSLIA